MKQTSYRVASRAYLSIDNLDRKMAARTSYSLGHIQDTDTPMKRQIYDLVSRICLKRDTLNENGKMYGPWANSRTIV